MGARILCAMVAMCMLPDASSAQSGLRSASLPDHTFTTSIQPAEPDLFRAGPDAFGSRADRPFGRHRQPFPWGGFVGGVLAASNPWRESHSAWRRNVNTQANGYLRLLVQPSTTEVHLDGFYLGSVDDYRQSGGTLEAGPHRVELRAPGHEPAFFTVNIAPNDTVTYRKNLDDFPRPGERSPTPAAAPAVPKAFYVIPGCFAGDKPPTSDRLSAACDITRVRTIPPVVSAIARGR
jgi:hypothetical protein